ncbi:hypothetical protein BPAE_0003g00320 [Botrytis paeoniae]|uniref:Uncharacterized protein n=1 Tax=Botrytis paeoniae TaxID=278948 RepID=A0A4Z1G4K5_9HELO|nr:hypothetical protein BPAE_0003g00320 [Botrytis paeoniae]
MTIPATTSKNTNTVPLRFSPILILYSNPGRVKHQTRELRMNRNDTQTPKLQILILLSRSLDVSPLLYDMARHEIVPLGDSGGDGDNIKRNAFEISKSCKQSTINGGKLPKRKPLHFSLSDDSSRRKCLLQTKGGRTVVALGATNGVCNRNQLAVGDQVGSSLVASWSNLLGNEEVETGILAGEPESAGGLDAGAAPLWNVWESSVAVGGDESGAFDTGGFHGAGLEHGEGVAGWGALTAVWDAAGAEVGDSEDAAALLDGGSRCESNGDGGDDSG